MTYHPPTPSAIDRAAKALAESLNGGNWWTHYTPDQRQVWIDRVKRAMT